MRASFLLFPILGPMGACTGGGDGTKPPPVATGETAAPLDTGYAAASFDAELTVEGGTIRAIVGRTVPLRVEFSQPAPVGGFELELLDLPRG